MTLPDMPPHELRAVAQVLANIVEDMFRVELKLPPSVAMSDLAKIVHSARLHAEVPQHTLRLVTA